MCFDFDRVIDRRASSSVKWQRYAGRDVIPLWIADMDFLCPPAVREALQAHLDHGIFGYDTPQPEHIEAVQYALQRDHGWTIEPEWILWLPGLIAGLNLTCRMLGGPGDEVLISTPVYPPFRFTPEWCDRTCVDVPMQLTADGWQLDLEGMARAITPRTRVLLLCHPHNPVGRLFTRHELQALADLCLPNDITICSDEIHCELVLETDRKHIPIATLSPEVAARTVTLMSPGKTYNIPGLYCAFAVIPDRGKRRAFRRARRGMVQDVNTLGLTALAAAYRHGAEWRQAMLGYLRENRDLLEQTIAETPGLRMTRVEATYLAWIDTRDAQIEDPAAFFEAAGVGLGDGEAFGGPGYVRLNFACPRSLLAQALDRMRHALAQR